MTRGRQTESAALRIERIHKRLRTVTDPKVRHRLLDEVLRLRGVYDFMDSERARKAELERPAVRADVERMRALTGATGEAEVITAPPLARVEEKRIDDPSESYAEWLEGVRTGRRDPGTRMANVNMASKIGGLANIRPVSPSGRFGKRKPHHERAAERFLNLYEARYGRVSPAVDPEREPVDTSPIAHDSGMAAALDATRAMEELEHGSRREDRVIRAPVFRPQEFQFLVAILCLGCTISHYTGTGGRALDKEVDRFLGLLDRLSEHWGLSLAEVA